MNVRYLCVAEEELGKAIEYYEDKEAGLGLRFYAEYRSAVERILTCFFIESMVLDLNH